ncbi:DC-STAMP domain-containing protein 2 [Platysternon megacephalum]|uniref:DC-STAMP domain-containing protein 2 n=1 Tax=Platysternon megacephalum TaxID=55544 RepID=A0A4D9DVR4_9SAUR|nr:DC-STAMP domain-containing protein 2 [Platysternon megacephalum]
MHHTHSAPTRGGHSQSIVQLCRTCASLCLSPRLWQAAQIDNGDTYSISVSATKTSRAALPPESYCFSLPGNADAYTRVTSSRLFSNQNSWSRTPPALLFIYFFK